MKFVVDFLNDWLGSEIPEDIESIALGNTSLKTIMRVFGNSLAEAQKSDVSNIVLPLNQRIREIKEFLFNNSDENNKITYSNECI